MPPVSSTQSERCALTGLGVSSPSVAPHWRLDGENFTGALIAAASAWGLTVSNSFSASACSAFVGVRSTADDEGVWTEPTCSPGSAEVLVMGSMIVIFEVERLLGSSTVRVSERIPIIATESLTFGSLHVGLHFPSCPYRLLGADGLGSAIFLPPSRGGSSPSSALPPPSCDRPSPSAAPFGFPLARSHNHQ
jgi:hypothetical protein